MKQAVYREYLSFFKGDKQAVQSAILEVTEGRGSKDWTLEDIQALQEDVAQRQEATEELLPAANQ